MDSLPRPMQTNSQQTGNGNYELVEQHERPQYALVEPDAHADEPSTERCKSNPRVSANAIPEENTLLHHGSGIDNTVTRGMGWMSFKLKWWFTGLIMAIQITIVVICIWLDSKSKSENGFRQLPDSVELAWIPFPSLWNRRLLWTTLPTLLMTIYSMSFGAVVESFRDRQPFVELCRPGGAPPERSIMLDYRIYFGLTSWWKMLRRGHRLMAAVEILKLSTVLAVVPLSAHLITDQFVPTNSPANITVTTGFSTLNFNLTNDLRPVFQTVAASLVQGGNFRPWTTGEYAFNTLSVNASQIGSALTAVNFTGTVSGWSTQLDCREIAVMPELTVVPDQSVPIASGQLSFVDRGCNVTTLLVLPLTKYVQGWSTYGCSRDAGSSRISVVALDLTDVDSPQSAVISCIPSYWQTPGNLTLSSIYGFNQPSSVVFQPFSSQRVAAINGTILDYESSLFKNAEFDVNGSTPISTLALLIQQYSTIRVLPSSPLSAGAILNSTVTVLKAVFAATASTYMETSYVTDETKGQIGQILPFTRSTLISKLLIVEWIAIAIASVVGLSAVFTLIATIYSHRHPSILSEEPNGILYTAALLRGSDVHDLVDEHLPPEEWNVHQGKISEQIQSRGTFGQAAWNGRWGVETLENGARRIVHFPRGQKPGERLAV